MWNLTEPDTGNPRTHLDTVFPVGAMPIVVSEADKDKLEVLYQQYRNELGRPSAALSTTTLSPEVQQAIHDAYGEVQVKRKLASLRDSLKVAALACPYCGFGQIQDLDHHLPKAVYRPFSVLAANLVPACATCNRHKPKKPKVGEPHTHLLNAYLEDLSQYKFLRADVTITITGALVVKFRVHKSENMSDELYARLVNHLQVFHLNERYVAQVNIYLGEQEPALEQAYNGAGPGGLRMFLEYAAVKSGSRFGTNDWRTALLEGLATSQKFCEGGFLTALGHGAAVHQV